MTHQKEILLFVLEQDKSFAYRIASHWLLVPTFYCDLVYRSSARPRLAGQVLCAAATTWLLVVAFSFGGSAVETCLSRPVAPSYYGPCLAVTIPIVG